jgi:hypothetical protein
VSAVCRRFLDEFGSTLDPSETAIEVIKSLVDCGLADVKLGNITVQSADLALDGAGAGSEFVELYFKPVEALVDVSKATAQKIDDLILRHASSCNAKSAASASRRTSR